MWVDKDGRKSPLPVKPQAYLHPRLSPDGRQLAIEVEGASHDVFMRLRTRRRADENEL